jgi:hypothetical protein
MSDNGESDEDISSWSTSESGLSEWTSPGSEGSDEDDSMEGSISDILETTEEEQVRSLSISLHNLSLYLLIYLLLPYAGCDVG